VKVAELLGLWSSYSKASSESPCLCNAASTLQEPVPAPDINILALQVQKNNSFAEACVGLFAQC